MSFNTVAYPLGKTGGLADVCATLPAALARAGVDVSIMLPGYRSALDGAVGKQQLGALAGRVAQTSASPPVLPSG